MDNSFVTHGEFEARMKREEDENTRQNRRIDKLEGMAERLTELASSTKVLAVTIESMQKVLEKQGSRIEKMEQKPADNWDKFVWLAFTAVVSCIIGIVLGKVGLT